MNEKSDPREALIREKVLAGLSREDALAVVKAQEEHDAALEKATETETKAKSGKK